MGFMDDDSRGFLISMDLLIAIIPLTIILGMVTADMGNIMFEIEDTVFRGSMDRVAADTMNTLLETSGDPPTWEQTGNPTVVGLAKYDQSKGKPIEGTISATKLEFLNASNVQDIIGNNYDYNLTISSINTSSSTIFKSLSSSNNNTGKDIVRVDKVVLCSKLETVSSLLGEIRYTGAPRDYNAPAFQTSYRYNQSYDYWIFFVNTGSASANSATIKINGNSINLNSSTINSAYKINSTFIKTCSTNPTLFLNNTVEVNITSSNFGNSMDFYVVQAPKGFTDVNYDNVVPKKCMFILYLWPK